MPRYRTSTIKKSLRRSNDKTRSQNDLCCSSLEFNNSESDDTKSRATPNVNKLHELMKRDGSINSNLTISNSGTKQLSRLRSHSQKPEKRSKGAASRTQSDALSSIEKKANQTLTHFTD